MEFDYMNRKVGQSFSETETRQMARTRTYRLIGRFLRGLACWLITHGLVSLLYGEEYMIDVILKRRGVSNTMSKKLQQEICIHSDNTR